VNTVFLNITVNGDATQLPSGASVAGLLDHNGHDPKRRGIAVALNGEVVPRSRWAEQQLSEGDVVELLTATQGG
jgi:sulfur carrier protein